MTINKKTNNDATTFELEGRLDTLTAPELESAFKAESVLKNVILDFAKLEYISSAGLRVLLMMQKTVQSNGSMVVKNVSQPIKEVFDLTGFSEILTIE